jgi:Ca-activated chloride channel family protein
VTFTWPLALLLVLAAPLLLAIYLLSLRRRRRQAVRYSSVALLRSVIPRRSRWKRHLPVALLLASIALLGVGAARPQRTETVSSSHTSVILALDVSRSMCATDVSPNRITVAQQEAKDFVEHQPAGGHTGLVVFAADAQLAVPPTTDRGALTRAIDNLSTESGTAIGAAILKSLDAIAEVDPAVKPVGDVPEGTGPGQDGSDSETGSAPAPPTPSTTAPPAKLPGAGGYAPDVIVLLTDGANNRGIAPLDAVPYAVDRKVRVYTIGFGTTQIASLACTAAQLGGEESDGVGAFGGFGSGSFGLGPTFGRSPLRADLPTLQQVAQRTGGIAYTAADASQLHKVFATLPKDVSVSRERHEISSTFVALGALFAVLAIGASIRWSPYP